MKYLFIYHSVSRIRFRIL